MNPVRRIDEWTARILALLLVVLAAGAVAASLLADVAGGEPGFGESQVKLLNLGLVLLATALVLRQTIGFDEVPDAPLGPIWIALLFALVAGLGQLLLVRVQNLLGQRFSHVPDAAPWLLPSSYALYLVPLGLLFAVLRRLGFQRVGSRRLAVFVMGFAALYGVLYVYHPELHPVAIVVLACGIAARSAASAAGSSRSGRRARSAGLLLAVVAVVWAGAVAGGRRLAESRARAGLTSAPPGAPNVLLLILDTVRATNSSLYGYPRPTTPRLEDFAREGVVFENAVSTAPWTLVSHAGVFTGLHPFEMAADWQAPLERGPPTLAEVLRDRGYATGGFVANDRYAGRNTGLDRGFLHYDADDLSLAQVAGRSSLGRRILGNAWARSHLRKKGGDVVDEFLDWLPGVGERPFFAFLNLFDAHDPYAPPTAFRGGFHTRDAPWSPKDSLGGAFHKATVREWIDGYDGSIAYVDAQVGRLLDELEARGVLERTIVIVTADHGEEFGENDVYFHGNSLYYPSLHVPLIVRTPAATAGGTRISQVVSLREIPATVMGLLGARPEAHPFRGPSLERYWVTGGNRDGVRDEPVVAETSGKDWVKARNPISRGDMHSVFEGYLHYIRDGTGGESLFDVSLDPLEHVDLSKTGRHLGALRRMRRVVASITRPYAEIRGRAPVEPKP
ncbi:MAG: sulfatase [Gemmatimonadota bacterium]